MTRIEEFPYGPGDLRRLCAVKPVMILFLCMLLFGGTAPLFAAPSPHADEAEKLKMIKELLRRAWT